MRMALYGLGISVASLWILLSIGGRYELGYRKCFKGMPYTLHVMRVFTHIRDALGRTQLPHRSFIMKLALHPQISAAPFYSQNTKLHGSCIRANVENEEDHESLYMDVPMPGIKWERKPYPTPMKVLICRAKGEKQARKENPCRILGHAPENGLLVPELIEVANKVHCNGILLLRGLSKLVEGDHAIPVHRCRFCPELHIGWQGHEIRTCEGPGSGSRNSYHVWRRGGVKDILGFAYCYHLFDRVGKPRVGHKDRFAVPRLPSVIELCIQAGLNLDGYPTKRRTAPVYSIEGRIVDFEMQNEEIVKIVNLSIPEFYTGSISEMEVLKNLNISELATKSLRSWLDLREGVMKIMKKYSVLTCGYCPEVQVGPKGHKVRTCKAAKHQFRDGQHAWQEATIDDLVRPNFVWHVRNPLGPPLSNLLKRYYGKAPAVVELCVQAGAPIPKEYKSMMRLDVILPDLDEYDLVT
ncbi:hypothetical protein HPP92_018583 [Vanilla planifolia]|uniref:APO domain-containing protein n=1 Tax=Vanilla planifolia TaxID=51239 RepID=A0A835UMJ3_VANPL|nr:hypothetical protein HPP92_018583 [Vanilla planifolia]